MNKPGKTYKLLIAGGGTGGHVSPGLAVAQEWQKQGHHVFFVGVETGQEAHMVPKHGFELCFINIKSFKGGGLVKKLLSLFLLPFAVWESLKIIRQKKPDLVLGMGGYVSGPACLAAFLLKKPLAIADQNAQPGITNRCLGSLAKKVFTSFQNGEKFFKASKVYYTGNPTRAQLNIPEYQPHTHRFNIFIFGGSQGAVGMNKKILSALGLTKHLWPSLNIVHQAGRQDIETVKSFYEQNNISAVVKPFFDNMKDCYTNAHVVICRSGASTISELAMAGRPAILIPFPEAADDHQKKNALALSEHKAAWLLDQNLMAEKDLADLLEEIYRHPEQLIERAQKVRQFAKPDAAKNIVKELVLLLKD